MKKNTKTIDRKDRKYVRILGINVLVTDKRQVLTAVKEKLSHNNKFYITTPNPELILASTKDNLLKEVLNNSDFSIPDGVGLSQAAKFLSFKTSNPFIIFFQGLFVGAMTILNKDYLTNNLFIYKGRELFLDLVEMLNGDGGKIFLLGGEGEEASLVARKLKLLYPKLVVESDKGPKVNNDGEVDSQIDIKLQKDLIDRINKFNTYFLFVAMGNPRQEKWVYKNISKLKVKGVMCVGGTFRYLAGISKLPFSWLENLGLEWLFRLITEPYRFKRIFNAVILFPLNVFLFKLKSK